MNQFLLKIFQIKIEKFWEKQTWLLYVTWKPNYLSWIFWTCLHSSKSHRVLFKLKPPGAEGKRHLQKRMLFSLKEDICLRNCQKCKEVANREVSQSTIKLYQLPFCWSMVGKVSILSEIIAIKLQQQRWQEDDEETTPNHEAKGLCVDHGQNNAGRGLRWLFDSW